MAKAKADTGEKKPSQRKMVQAALQELGMDAKPQDLQGVIMTKFNVDLPPNIISNYKSQIKRAAGVGTGRQDGSFHIEDFEAVRSLVRKLGADQVKRLVDVLS